MMSKISVKGDDIHPLYKQLTDAKGQVTWNFNKFLIGKDGKADRALRQQGQAGGREADGRDR
jgi:glutathione peroxidase